MAEAEAVRDAIARLTSMVDDVDDATRRKIPDSTVSVLVPDVDLAFTCRFDGGHVHDVQEVDPAALPAATLRVTSSSDTLIDVVDGELHFGRAWATGKLRVDAKVRDLLKLRSFL